MLFTGDSDDVFAEGTIYKTNSLSVQFPDEDNEIDKDISTEWNKRTRKCKIKMNANVVEGKNRHTSFVCTDDGPSADDASPPGPAVVGGTGARRNMQDVVAVNAAQ